jgi:hypothetical protein
MTVVTKFVRDNDWLQFEYDASTNNEKVTASDPSIIALYNSFVVREQNEEWVPGKGDFYADVDGLESEAGFTRIQHHRK